MQHNGRVTVIFVSGGIGTGKSTFINYCKTLGADVVSADEIVSDLYENDLQMVSELKSILGPKIIDKDNRIDKKFIAEQIFTNSELRIKVEAIIHPKVSRKLKDFASRSGLLVYEIPVLKESTDLSLADYVVIITAPDQLRIERAIGRGMSREDVLQRIWVQTQTAFIPKQAIIISNDSSKAVFEAKVQDFIRKIKND